MIINDPRLHFICIFSKQTIHEAYYGEDSASYLRYQGKRLTNKEYLLHWGKWVALGNSEEIEKLAGRLDPYVEQGLVPCCKYDRTPLKEFDLTECVMCVYCDDRQKDAIWQTLTDLGVTVKAWIYEREVMERWSPGGVSLEKWLATQGLDEEKLQEARERARQHFEQKYIKEHDWATGWNHHQSFP